MYRTFFSWKSNGVFLKTYLKNKKSITNANCSNLYQNTWGFMHKYGSSPLFLVTWISSLVMLVKKNPNMKQTRSCKYCKIKPRWEKIVYPSFVKLTSLDAAIWLIYSPSVKRIFCPSVWQSAREKWSTLHQFILAYIHTIVSASNSFSLQSDWELYFVSREMIPFW